MTIRILFFAALANQLGAAEQSLELPAGATVADALGALQEQHPDLAVLRAKIAVAVNLEYVGENQALADGDELALIGPVSGG